MKTILFTALAMAATLTACRQQPETTGTRIIFDAGDQRVISHAVNKRLETMSILYGNAAAYAAALSGDGNHQPGERYTFVTWRYHDNPMWYGSKVTGELLSVEQLQATSPSGEMDYKVQRGNVPPVNGRLLKEPERVRYLLGFRPSIIP